MRDIKRVEFQMKIYGEVFNLKKPNLKKVLSYQKKLKELGEDGDATELMLDTLDTCGLRKDFAMEMDPDDLLEVIGVLMPKAKK